MASDEQRTGPEAEPPAEGGAEPEGLPAPARAPRVQYAADQLQGLGEALRGLGRAILATTGPLKTKPDPLPPHEIGERDLAFLDYKRLAGTRRLVRVRREIECNKTRLIDWEDSKELGEDPEACRTLTGTQVRAYIKEQINAAKAAAAALCTDPACPDAHPKVTYQSWSCFHTIVNEKHRSTLSVVLQLEVRCEKDRP